jgi:hypothetical protein
VPGTQESAIAPTAVERIGLVKRDCLSVDGPFLEVGTRVYVVTLDPPHRIVSSEVRGRRTSGCHYGLEQKYSSYTLSQDGWGMGYVDSAVGLINFASAPMQADGSLGLRFSDDPRRVNFRTCSSNEGFHITAWRNGRRIWHAYEWVPYGTPNTCTAEETTWQADSVGRSK